MGALALATVVAPHSAAAEPQHTAAIDQLIRQGIGHDADGNYEVAAATWERLRELAPDAKGFRDPPTGIRRLVRVRRGGHGGPGRRRAAGKSLRCPALHGDRIKMPTSARCLARPY